MSKFLFFIFLVSAVFFGTAVYALETNGIDTDSIIRSRAFLNSDGMTQLVRSTEKYSIDEKNTLYYQYRMKPWLGAGLNILLPGLGSWIMGDTAGALINEAGLLVAGGAVGVCAVLFQEAGNTV